MLAAPFRFHGHRSLSFLFRQGKSVRRRMISLKFVHNQRRTHSRCAVVVGRKVSKSAPVRNRIRRRIYEVVRTHWDEIAPSHDLVFFVYDSSVATMPYAELEEIITGLLQDAQVTK